MFACITLWFGSVSSAVRKSDIRSLDFVVNRFFVKLFQTNNIDIVGLCE